MGLIFTIIHQKFRSQRTSAHFFAYRISPSFQFGGDLTRKIVALSSTDESRGLYPSLLGQSVMENRELESLTSAVRSQRSTN